MPNSHRPRPDPTKLSSFVASGRGRCELNSQRLATAADRKSEVGTYPETCLETGWPTCSTPEMRTLSRSHADRDSPRVTNESDASND